MMILELFNGETTHILTEIKPSVVMCLQTLAFHAGKGKQRSEQAARNSQLQTLFNNAQLLLSGISWASPQEKQALYTTGERAPVFTSARDPDSDSCPRQYQRPGGFGGKAGSLRRSRAGVAAARSQHCSLRGTPRQRPRDPQALHTL